MRAVQRALYPVNTQLPTRTVGMPLYQILRARGMSSKSSETDQAREIKYHRARFDDYILQKYPEKVWEHFNALRSLDSFKGDTQPYQEFMEACLQQKDTGSVIKIKDIMEKDNVPFNHTMYAFIWQAYLKEGKTDAALSTFSNLQRSGIDQDLVEASLYELMNDLVEHGHVGIAIDFIDKMQREGFKIKINAYNPILSHYVANEKSLPEVRAWIQKAKDAKIKLDDLSYACLVVSLAENGELKEALKTYNEMQMQGFNHSGANATLVELLVKNDDVPTAVAIFEDDNKILMQESTIRGIVKAIENGTIPPLHLGGIIQYLISVKTQDDEVYKVLHDLVTKNKEKLPEEDYFELINATEELKVDDNYTKMEKENPCKQQ